MAEAYELLDKATAAEAWEWLQENNHDIAAGVQQAVKAGAKPHEIFVRTLDRLGVHRRALAVRIKLAAEHLSDI